MEFDKNPAILLKQFLEWIFPEERLDKDWEEAWAEVIAELDRHVPSNDN